MGISDYLPILFPYTDEHYNRDQSYQVQYRPPEFLH